MLKRLLAIVLMLAVPVQGFAVPHSHGSMTGTQPDGHNQIPHIHLGGHLQPHGHSHSHGHSHPDGHSHDLPSKGDQGSEQDSGTPETPTLPNHHDDDAIYFSGQMGLNLSQAVQTVADTGVVIWVVAVQPRASTGCSRITEAPHFLDRGSTPIYLTTLSLRL